MKLGIVGGIIVLAFDIWAIAGVVGSRLSPAAKILWVCGILVFPVFGMLAWFVLGRPRTLAPTTLPRAGTGIDDPRSR